VVVVVVVLVVVVVVVDGAFIEFKIVLEILVEKGKCLGTTFSSKISIKNNFREK